MAPTNYLDQLILKSYPVPTLTVRRTNITADAPIQGKLTFRGKQWDTVERLGTPWVRKGTYIVEMRLKVDNKNGDRKGLVFTEVPSSRPLMVHDAWNDTSSSTQEVSTTGIRTLRTARKKSSWSRRSCATWK